MITYHQHVWAQTTRVPVAVDAKGRVRVGPDRMARLLAWAALHANRDGEFYLSSRGIQESLGINAGHVGMAFRAFRDAGLFASTGRKVDRTPVWRVLFPADLDGPRSHRTAALDMGSRTHVDVGSGTHVNGADVGSIVGSDVGSIVGSDVGSGTPQKGKGKDKGEGEDVALPRDPPPRRSIPNDPGPPPPEHCQLHRDGNPDDVACRGCAKAREVFDRWKAAAADALCRYGDCTRPRDPGSPNRYCEHHEQAREGNYDPMPWLPRIRPPTPSRKCPMHGWSGGLVPDDDGRLVCGKCADSSPTVTAAADPSLNRSDHADRE